MQNPVVSIVMSAFNAELYLEATVESILRQTFQDFEFIIVDDCSTDHTWAILSRYAEHDSRIVLLRNPQNAGVVKALNTGLDQVHSGIIARQDADDVSHPSRIAMQKAFLESNSDYGLVAAVPQLIDSNGTELPSSTFCATTNEEIQSRLLDNMCLCGPSIMFRREHLVAVGGYFSEGLNASEDYDLCLRVAEVTKLASLEGYLYQYRQHAQSASHTQELKQTLNKAVALDRAIRRRYVPAPDVGRFAFVGRDYLRAAVIAVAQHDLAKARQCLKNALEVYPPLLQTDQPLVGLVQAYTPCNNIDSALHYTKNVFDELLPVSRRLSMMRSRLISSIHMSRVFSLGIQPDCKQLITHFWPAIWHNPRWIANKGVLSILAKSIFPQMLQRSTAKTHQHNA